MITARAPSRATFAKAIRGLLRERGAGKSICPSDVARAVGGAHFRRWLPLVRSVAGELLLAGEIIALQKGKRVELEKARGPIRLAAASIAKTSYVDGIACRIKAMSDGPRVALLPFRKRPGAAGDATRIHHLRDSKISATNQATHRP